MAPFESRQRPIRTAVHRSQHAENLQQPYHDNNDDDDLQMFLIFRSMGM